MTAAAEFRVYRQDEVAWFYRTKEERGGLSNMAGGYPLVVNGIRILTSEALYQACRFPYDPDVQKLIIAQRSPMTAKMKSKVHRHKTRPDWDAVRVKVMEWCLRVKLAQHWESFGQLLLSTGDGPIVEVSRRDQFWGARPSDDGTLVGLNVLGRLLRKLRDELNGPNPDSLRSVAPLDIPDFLLGGEPIGIIGCGPDESALPLEAYVSEATRVPAAVRETTAKGSKANGRGRTKRSKHSAEGEVASPGAANKDTKPQRGRKPRKEESTHQLELDEVLSSPCRELEINEQDMDPEPALYSTHEPIATPARRR
jgi:ribA/ribD-fused uncharacterized protein